MAHKLDDATMEHVKRLLASPDVKRMLSKTSDDPGPHVRAYTKDWRARFGAKRKAARTRMEGK